MFTGAAPTNSSPIYTAAGSRRLAMGSERSNPYVGTPPFEEKDSDYFFGRGAESRQLTSLIIAQRAVLFYAQSGAGKTSLLQASVIPTLKRRKKMVVLPIARVAGDLPHGVDPGQVTNIYVFNALSSLAGAGAGPGDLVDVSLEEGLESHLAPQPDERRPRPRLLILDQFEELFTTHPGHYTERAGFFRQLQDALGTYPQLTLLLSMREDFIAHLDPYAGRMPDRLRTRYRMQRLTDVGAVEAVEGPAQRAGRPFEPGVARELVDNLRRVQAGTLATETASQQQPLGIYVEALHLQIVCRRLWDGLPPEGDTIRAEDVHEFGDVDEALIGLYEDSLVDAIEQTGEGERRLRTWFEEELITPANTRGLVYQGKEETGGLPNRVVEILADAYVLRRTIRGTDVWYELAHDRLVDPILQANRTWRLARHEVVPWLRQAEEWKAQGEPNALLLDGQRLMLAQRWRDEQSEPLAPHEERFLQRSREARLDAAPWLRQAELWLSQGEIAELLLGAETLPGATDWARQHARGLAPHEQRFLRLSEQAFQRAEQRRAAERRLDSVPWLRRAKEWLDEGEPADLLLGTSRLPGATAWARQHPEELTPHERRFLRLSEEAFQQAERQRAIERRTNLADLGWGVIFAWEDEGDLPNMKQALVDLLDWRRHEAGSRYREFAGTNGYRPNETAEEFLVKHGAGPGTADPDKVPYYLLIVGDPVAIPFEFQYALDVHHAVGRVHFDTLEDYRRYARSVVAAERGGLALPRQAAFFGVQNPDDRSTTLSTQGLLKPLSVKIARDRPEWSVQVFVPPEAAPAEIRRSMARLTESVEVQPEGDATKAQLGRLLGGDQTPALVFTTSHGMSFSSQDQRQLAHQGALLCQDWPGPEAWMGKGPIPDDFYFGADDVPSDARLLGLLVFFWGPYTAGTPSVDDFAPHRTGSAPKKPAPHAFVARLPQRLLAHPQGGALAVIGHVEKIWTSSFQTKGAGAQLAVFEETLQRLMGGHTVGSAMERFNRQYALLSSLLVDELQQIEFGRRADPSRLAEQWTRTIDARNYVILGDPAVRLPVAWGSAPPSTRPALFTGGEGLVGPVARLDATLQRLERRLQDIVEGVAAIEVQTYVADDMALVPGDLEGTSEPLAQTRLELDGDTQVVLPMPAGAMDQRLFRLHNEAVSVALAGWTATVRAATTAASGLRGLPEVSEEPEEPRPDGRLEGVTHRVV
jgi:hypothetical protein